MNCSSINKDLFDSRVVNVMQNFPQLKYLNETHEDNELILWRLFLG